MTPAQSLGTGWILELVYEAADRETTLPIGLWTGSFTELRDWFVRVNDLVGAPVKPPSAISRIRERGKVLAVPAWALSSAVGGKAQAYKRHWMDLFLANVCRILATRYGMKDEPAYDFARRQPQETWLSVFLRLTPDIKPERAIDVCFEPLFLSPRRRGDFDIVPFGHIQNITVAWRQPNPRMSAFRKRLPELMRRDESIERASKAGGSSGNVLFERYVNLLKETALSQASEKRPELGEPLTILSQIGTISDEVVSELIAGGHVSQRSCIAAPNLSRLVKEMADTPNFLLFCDDILLGDIQTRWEEDKAADLATQLFPLARAVPVGMPFAAGDDEWGGILKEALLAVARQDKTGSWKATLEEFESINVDIDPNFEPAPARRHA